MDRGRKTQLPPSADRNGSGDDCIDAGREVRSDLKEDEKRFGFIKRAQILREGWHLGRCGVNTGGNAEENAETAEDDEKTDFA